MQNSLGISFVFALQDKSSHAENKMVIMYGLQSFVTKISFSVDSKENEHPSITMSLEK